ncbi:MAG: DMT family transporter [Hyphomicrobiales bacterium]|nr:DMT family transporter [Hyphomicrobiales bacterium]MCP5001663.1 DMT family transporter [Hyphomicrobiales bacterium]
MTPSEQTTSGHSPQHTAAYAVMVLTPLFFSSNIVFGRATVSEVAPFTLAFLRWGFCAVILSPFVLSARTKVAKLMSREPFLIIALGVLGMGVSGAGPYYGLQYTTATNGTLLYTTSPIMIILFERVFFGRMIRWREMIGVGIAFAGVAVILFNGNLERLMSGSLNIGDLVIIIAALSWAGYSILFKDSRLSGLPIMTLFGLVCVIGAVVLLPLALFELLSGAKMPVTVTAWQGIAGIVVFSSLLAFSGFQYGLRTLGPSLTGIFLYLLPAYGVLLAVVLLDEQIETYHIIGIFLVLFGVVLATFPKRKKLSA